MPQQMLLVLLVLLLLFESGWGEDRSFGAAGRGVPECVADVAALYVTGLGCVT